MTTPTPHTPWYAPPSHRPFWLHWLVALALFGWLIPTTVTAFFTTLLGIEAWLKALHGRLYILGVLGLVWLVPLMTGWFLARWIHKPWAWWFVPLYSGASVIIWLTA